MGLHLPEEAEAFEGGSDTTYAYTAGSEPPLVWAWIQHALPPTHPSTLGEWTKHGGHEWLYSFIGAVLHWVALYSSRD